jgi:hypothetical protein
VLVFNFSPKSSGFNVKLFDFGNGSAISVLDPGVHLIYFIVSPPSDCPISSNVYRSPESWLGSPWGTTTDIWSFEIIVSDLLSCRSIYTILLMPSDCISNDGLGDLIIFGITFPTLDVLVQVLSPLLITVSTNSTPNENPRYRTMLDEWNDGREAYNWQKSRERPLPKRQIRLNQI